MKFIKLAFFLAVLFAKNLKSVSVVFFEGFGFQTAVMLLVTLNIGIAAALFWSILQEQKLQKELATAGTHLNQQRQFWQKLSNQFPGNKEIQRAVKTLNLD